MSQLKNQPTTGEPAPPPLPPVEDAVPGTRKPRRSWVVVGGLVLLAVAAAWWLLLGPATGSGDADALTVAVRQSTLVISVTESGTLASRENEPIKCELEGGSTIISLVDEGTWVNKGDKLVELDASGLEEKLEQQKITFENALSAHAQAEAELAIQISQNESNIKQASLKVEFAELDLNKYIEGEYPQQKRSAEADITVAQLEYKQSQKRLGETKKLHQDGYVTQTELEADELEVRKRELALQQAEEALKVLEQYTHKKAEAQLRSDLEEAIKNLKRVQDQAASAQARAEADLKAKKSTLELQKAKLKRLNEQSGKTVIRAPRAGMVVYASQRGHWRRSSSTIELGTRVNERQALIELPDTSHMIVDTRVHESMVDQVRPGLRADVKADAYPDRRLSAKVIFVSPTPEQSGWMSNPDLKLYKTTVEIQGSPEGLKPGMSAEVTIFVRNIPDALIVPIQCVTTDRGETVCYVVNGSEPERRVVRIGPSNETHIQILEGLQKDERVLLVPPHGEPLPLDQQQAAPVATQPAASQPGEGGASQAEPGTDQPAVDRRSLMRKLMTKMRGASTPEQRQKVFDEFYEPASPEEKKLLDEMKKRILSGQRPGRRPGGGSGERRGGSGRRPPE